MRKDMLMNDLKGALRGQEKLDLIEKSRELRKNGINVIGVTKSISESSSEEEEDDALM
jgi:hypothetical protein